MNPIERAKSRIKDDPSWLLMLLVPLALVLSGGGFRSLAVHNAEMSLTELVQKTVPGQEEALKGLSADEAAAKKLYPSKYLQGLKGEELSQQLDQVRSMADKAKDITNPDKKLSSIGQANRLVKDIVVGVSADKKYLSELEAAKNNYQKEIDALGRELDDIQSGIANIRGQGFQEAYLRRATASLQQLRLSHAQAVQLATTPVEDDKTDFVEAYRLAKQKRGDVPSVNEQINEGPDLRAKALRAIADYSAQVSRIDSKIPMARTAATKLASYKAYAEYASTANIGSFTTEERSKIARARAMTSMDAQEFQDAITLLASSRGVATEAQLDHVIEMAQNLQDAIDKMDSERGDASKKIDEAQREINEYDYNSQTHAKSLLDDARDSYNDAGGHKKSDPLKAYHQYQVAYNRAQDAKNAVDTSARPSDDDDDDLGGALGTVFSGSGSDSGSGSYTGSGSDSGSSTYSGGGGYTASPSGGYDSGPSGGYASSPSGGYGNGWD